MGCASSKKQTTSVEDIPKAVEKAGSKPTQSSAPTNKSKNGQVTANANANEFKLGSPPAKKDVVKPTSATPPESSTASDAIQIPGAHKSFLAPDGIPFIDEDVDDEIETGHPEGDNSSIPVVGGTVVVKPDVNKNVVKEPVSPSQPPAQPSVAPVKAPTAVAAAPERHPNDQPTPAQPPQQQQQPSEQDKSWVAAVDVLKSDLEFPTQPVVEQTSTTHVTETHSSVTVTTITTTSNVDHQVEPLARQISDEQQQQAAAVKIQAGIRGYRDRQRVKAIRAARLSQGDASAAAVSGGKDDHIATDDQQLSSDLSTAVKAEEITLQEQSGQGVEHDEQQDSSEHYEDDDDADPEKQRAAVKIQASYKGWKARKELGKVKE